MEPLQKIDALAKQVFGIREDLTCRVSALEQELETVRQKHMVGIKRCVAAAATWQGSLRTAIENNPELFTKPRTLVLHGIKVGYQKGKGTLAWDDDQLVVKLIKKNFPEDTWDVLIKTTEKPRKDGLNGLDVKDLRKIGVTAEDTGDQVVVRPVDSDVDKIVKALLKDQEDMEEAA